MARDPATGKSTGLDGDQRDIAFLPNLARHPRRHMTLQTRTNYYNCRWRATEAAEVSRGVRERVVRMVQEVRRATGESHGATTVTGIGLERPEKPQPSEYP